MPLITQPVPIFLSVLLIILAAPLLLTRFKIPHVIGLIMAGVLVGPYGLNCLGRDMSFEVFGQVGVLYLMFLAGVEIDMYHLKRNLRKGMVFGTYTFLVPLVLGTVAGHLLLGLDVITSVLMASMFSAHTLIAYPIVSRLGLTKSRPVVIAIAGTIFTVLGSLVVLAGVVGVLRHGEFELPAILRLLGMLGLYCLVVGAVFPRVTRWFFKRYSDGILQFIYVLAMVFLAAQAAIMIDIEGVFGAFYAGIVLNRYVPARSSLMSRLEFAGNAIFIPYFLIGVGMLINVRVIFAGWETLYVGAVMTAVAMGTKWLAAWLTQRTFGMGALDRRMMYQLSNAHTAVALAVVMTGYGLGVFGETILNGTVLMILVTCTVSSMGTSQAATRLKVRQLEHDAAEAESETAASHKRKAVNTLIPIANPAMSRELVELAIMMRGGEHRRGTLYALHVRNDNTPASRALGRNSLEMAEQLGAGADIPIHPIERYDLNFVTGVTNTVEERDIGEVVIGLHRRTQFVDSFFGDKLTQLIRANHRMVVISRCFIPLATVSRIVVVVPPKAEYETGFSQWVRNVAHLGRQIGCRVIFFCMADTKVPLEAVIGAGRIAVSAEYRIMEQWEDFVLLANKIGVDDLLVVVNSRRAAVSFTPEMDTLPDFLQHNFAANNLIVIYPEQFGNAAAPPTLADVMSTDVVSTPSPLWLHLRRLVRRISGHRHADLDL